MIRYFMVILLVLGILAGCALNPSTWENGDEPEDQVDLQLHLKQMDPDKVGNVDLNGNGADKEDAPTYAQQLETAIRPPHSNKQKVVKQLTDGPVVEPTEVQSSGKKFVRQKNPSADLVGSSGESVDDQTVEAIADFNPDVDLLVIKDVSKSNLKMIERSETQEVGGFLPLLNDMLSWRLGFLSADELQEGSHLLNLVLNGEVIQNRNFITQDTQNYEDIFVETMTHNTRSVCKGCGKRKERPLGALKAFLESDSADRFLRPSADLAVVIITDNDEQRYNRKGQMITSEHIMAIMKSKYENKVIRGYSLTILDDECRKKVRSGSLFKEGKYAPVITEFSDRTQGGSFSLCTPSYSEVAEEIVLDQQNN